MRGHADKLGVLVADEVADTLDEACRLVEQAGHVVVARQTDLDAVAGVVRAGRPDLAIVALHHDGDHALRLLERLHAAGACPTVMLLDDDDPDLVEAALQHGLDAYTGRATPDGLRCAIALAQRRFHERRAMRQHPPPDLDPEVLVEQAKGILMERHGIDGQQAYALLRRQARDRRITVADVAISVVRARDLLPPQPESERAPSE